MSIVKLQSEYDDLDKYEYLNRDIVYYKKNTGLRHNKYGPAYIGTDGYIAYFIDGIRHRLDGPARIFKNGKKEYYINNEYLTKKEFELHPERLKFLDKEYLICLI